MFVRPDLRCDDMLYDDVLNEQGSALGMEMLHRTFPLILLSNNKVNKEKRPAR